MSGFVTLRIVHGEFPDDPQRWEVTVPFSPDMDFERALDDARRLAIGQLACSAFQHTPVTRNTYVEGDS